jgi:hypothetical protein
VGPRQLVVVASKDYKIVDPSSTGRVAPFFIVVVVWMAAPFMVVASTRDWSGVQLLVEEDLWFLVGRCAPSCKEPTSS